MKNDLILERSKNVTGLYEAGVHIGEEYFVSSSYHGWEDAINNLLAKIVWYFHGIK